ncbi:MAG TPA: hypothetical protein VGP67_07230 [Gaiellales bacterium]|jgi:hypothetical protein|nr:hypothetical protein [Gaiellales bacterium]
MSVQAVEEIVLVTAVCMIVVGLWPGPWRVSLGLKAGDEQRIKGIKEAIDILEHELALLEPVEPEPRSDRLLRLLRTLVQPSR